MLPLNKKSGDGSTRAGMNRIVLNCKSDYHKYQSDIINLQESLVLIALLWGGVVFWVFGVVVCEYVVLWVVLDCCFVRCWV